MSLDVTTLALAKSYTNQHSGGGVKPFSVERLFLRMALT